MSGHPGQPRPAGDVVRKIVQFAKRITVKQLVPQNASVCDLFSDVSHTFDIWNAQSPKKVWTLVHPEYLDRANEKAAAAGSPSNIEFVGCNAIEGIHDALGGAPPQLDAICCMSGLGRCFDNESSAKRMLRSVVDRLKPGAFFFGVCLDSAAVWGKCIGGKGEFLAQQPVNHRKKLYQIHVASNGFKEYGTRTDLRFQGGYGLKETLGHFPTMIDILKENGMQYIDIMNLGEYCNPH